MGKHKTPLEDLPWQTRLGVRMYNKDDCNAAIRGEKIPSALGLKVHRFCVIRGIRNHDGFAHELRGVAPEFTRALNAREIMSGVIPGINDPSEIPYCIWYPEVPSQETLKKLVKRYPNMIYHAARTCAVAGYSDLYLELQVLPEIHIAAEARDAALARKNKGSEVIYEHIMSKHLKFEIMNDYDRSVNVENPRPACLNGDTAVFSDLSARLLHSKATPPSLDTLIDYVEGDEKYYNTYNYFNITEDMGIDDHKCGAPAPLASYWPLLYSPLPTDLPPINKDNLILAAAYLGNVDRYTRLRRPQMIEQEFHAVIWGIFHYPLWARWWSIQVPEVPTEDSRDDSSIRRAINIRRIISDDITCITSSTPEWLIPDRIWWPTVASPETYVRLAKKRPDMLGSCLRACIVADYQDTWDELLTAPLIESNSSGQNHIENDSNNPRLARLAQAARAHIYAEAKDSSNPHYLEDIKSLGTAKVKELEASTYYLDDMRTAKQLYSPRSVHTRVIFKNKPFALTTGESGSDGIPRRPGDLGFMIFGMDAIGLDNKRWEQRSWMEVKDMYEILDTQDLST